jgi:NAD-dependent SIR2 family protein deacetylase
MQSLINKGKIRMAMQDDAASSVNESGTCQKIDTPLTQAGSRDVRRQGDLAECDQCGKTIPQECAPWEFRGKFYCEKCAEEIVAYLEEDSAAEGLTRDDIESPHPDGRR